MMLAIIHVAGGHTSEMLRLTEKLSEILYSPRIYVHADTDKLSAHKATQAEGESNPY